MQKKKVFGASVPSVELVKIGDLDVEIRGLTFEQLISLFGKFPEIVNIVDKSKDLSIGSFADPVVNAMIAIATGVHDDEEQEATIASLPIGRKAALIASIIRQTAPDGIGPFVELLLTIQGQQENVGKIKLRSTKSSERQPTSVLQASAV